MNTAVSAGGGGVGGGEKESDKVLNCTIVGNSAGWGGGINKTDAYNSIICNNKAQDGPDVNGEYMVLNSCSPNLDYGNNSGNIRQRPRFVNAQKGDYRLLPNSPCIDAGSNSHTNQLADLDGNPRIVDGDRDGNAVVDIGAYEYQLIRVEIDVKPGSKSDSINLKARGLLPVAILTTDTFDVSTVNPSTVRFAGSASARRMFQDVDDDGDLDLLLQFDRRKLKLDEGSNRALLTGETKDRQLFIGEATLQIVR